MQVSKLTPKLMPKILEADEKILWIRAARFSLQSKLATAFFGLLFAIFFLLFLTQIVFPFFQGEVPEFEGKAVTLNLIFFFAAVFAALFLFFILAIRAQRAVRYIVTDRRAFIFQPSLGISFNYDLTEKKWKRDYAATDDERDLGPIAQGGYFTDHTEIETKPANTLIISGLNRSKNPVEERDALIKKIPMLGLIPSGVKDVTIKFDALEDVETARLKISHVIKTYQSRLKA